MGPEIYRVRQNNAIMLFKVTDFGTNRKLICYFLLVINTDLPPILHCFQVVADLIIGQIFGSDWGCDTEMAAIMAQLCCLFYPLNLCRLCFV